MAIGYHIDRSGKLHEGMILDLDKDTFKDMCEICAFFNQNYSQGLSKHGLSYYEDKFGSFTNMNSQTMEQHLELLRLASHSEIPSRFNTFSQ